MTLLQKVLLQVLLVATFAMLLQANVMKRQHVPALPPVFNPETGEWEEPECYNNLECETGEYCNVKYKCKRKPRRLQSSRL